MTDPGYGTWFSGRSQEFAHVKIPSCAGVDATCCAYIAAVQYLGAEHTSSIIDMLQRAYRAHDGVVPRDLRASTGPTGSLQLIDSHQHPFCAMEDGPRPAACARDSPHRLRLLLEDESVMRMMGPRARAVLESTRGRG